MQILSLIVLSFYHFEGSFHFWALLWGLVLRRFSTSSSLMSFSPFSCFLWLLSLLVVSSSFFLFSSHWGVSRLLSLFCVRRFRLLCFVVVVVVVVFCWAVFHPDLCLLVLFSPVCWAWIHSLFSFFSLGLFFGLPVFSDSVLNNLQRCCCCFWYTDLFF